MVIRHTSTISYHITSLQGPRVHLPVTLFIYLFILFFYLFIYKLRTQFLFRDTTFHLALTRFVFHCAKNMELVTFSHPQIPNILFFQASS